MRVWLTKDRVIEQPARHIRLDLHRHIVRRMWKKTDELEAKIEVLKKANEALIKMNAELEKANNEMREDSLAVAVG